ncbi:MAG: type I restriction-modification system subunit M [Rubrobacteraceae bacterium]
MAVKKSELYRSLWSSCDELRGGMDASQYKDYVLTLLFVKYVSDKYAGKRNAMIEVPEYGGFEDMVRLRGDKDIGEGINKIIRRLADENDLRGVIDVADFNDEDKLGSGREMVDRLSRLIGIFAGLNLSANRAEGDDLLGDAYEYLMRHFATESGKSKGQFYTPAEVSRVIARRIGVGLDTQPNASVYDPTCGSGSLLLKVADETSRGISIYGQEMDNATHALARMNMILHDAPTADIRKGNTLSNPRFIGPKGGLKTFDFAVANPPFSAKSWSNGLDPDHDEYGRFEPGVPPAKNGDYAFLLHVLASLTSTGKGAVILPHGVLFRGHAEANIRQYIVRQGYIKGIIGLPPNLFYGTGIPACIVVLDKENAGHRRPVFMVDASGGFMKDGNKNRLRSQDLHKIVDVFNHALEVPRYSRLVEFEEVETNGFNLNIPRYIDSGEPEDLHDLGAHLRGGIPDRDIDALADYWEVFPTLRRTLFGPGDRPGYSDARVPAPEVRDAVLGHPEFESFTGRVRVVFEGWRAAHEPTMKGLEAGSDAKAFIREISEDLLVRFSDVALVSRYDVYQHLMDYWAATMQDDVYAIAQDGWEAGRVARPAHDGETPEVVTKRGGKTARLVGELIPPHLMASCFFAEDQAGVERLAAASEAASQAKLEFEEEHGGEDGPLSELDGKPSKSNVQNRVMELRELALETVPMYTPEYEQAKSIKRAGFGTAPWERGLRDDNDLFAELDALHDYLRLVDAEARARKDHKAAADALDRAVVSKYPDLTTGEIKTLVVDGKWIAAMEGDVRDEIERVTRTLAGRVKALDERYAEPLPALAAEVDHLTAKVEAHLKQMGLAP